MGTSSSSRLVDKDKQRRKLLGKVQRGSSISDAARLTGCGYETARRWVRDAERLGFDEAMKPRTSPKKWSNNLKREVATAYMNGTPAADLVKTYRLPYGNYPEMWAKSLGLEDGMEAEDLALRAANKALAAWEHGDQFWREWITRMRKYFDQAQTEAANDAERVRLLQMQADILEKCFALRSLENNPKRVLDTIVTDLKATYTIKSLVTAVGIPRATYYWRSQHSAEQQKRDQEICERIQDAYEESYHAYGYRRMTLCLRQGLDQMPPILVNHKRIARLMNMLNLRGATPTKRRYNSFAGPDPESVNRLDRKFHTDKPGEVLVTDISMFSVGAHRVFLSPLLDLFNNEVIAWRIESTASGAMANGMLREGLEKLPKNSTPLVHTDQGRQYTSRGWKEVLTAYGAVQSMSRVGNCHDNAPAESFFGRVKTEFGRGENYSNVHSFVNALDRYIRWWNTSRIVQRLGTSPVRYAELKAA